MDTSRLPQMHKFYTLMYAGNTAVVRRQAASALRKIQRQLKDSNLAWYRYRYMQAASGVSEARISDEMHLYMKKTYGGLI